MTTHLVQRWVPKAFEVRVIVLGHHLTAAAIHASNAASMSTGAQTTTLCRMS